jgi:hypothetical protein
MASARTNQKHKIRPAESSLFLWLTLIMEQEGNPRFKLAYPIEGTSLELCRKPLRRQ